MARVVLHKELFDYDKTLREKYPVVCGVDEAGRGPLAGDVYAAAVVHTEICAESAVESAHSTHEM